MQSLQPEVSHRETFDCQLNFTLQNLHRVIGTEESATARALVPLVPVTPVEVAPQQKRMDIHPKHRTGRTVAWREPLNWVLTQQLSVLLPTVNSQQFMAAI